MADADLKVDVNFYAIDYDKVTKEAVKKMSKTLLEAERAEVTAGGMGKYAKRQRVIVRNRGDRGFEVQVFARPNWMWAWEWGFTSTGDPILWVPAPGNLFRKIPAKKYPGKLIKLPGKNILLNAVTRKVAYIGIKRTSGGVRLHMREVAQREAAKFSRYIKQEA